MKIKPFVATAIMVATCSTAYVAHADTHIEAIVEGAQEFIETLKQNTVPSFQYNGLILETPDPKARICPAIICYSDSVCGSCTCSGNGCV